MAYRVEFTTGAARDLRKMPRDMQIRIAAKVDALTENPRPHGVEKLSAQENLYRVRVGDYRIIYQIRDDRLLILVVRIGHRREVYRR